MAVIYEKPRTVVNADYVWRRTDRWINFPWSTSSAWSTRGPRPLTARVRPR